MNGIAKGGLGRTITLVLFGLLLFSGAAYAQDMGCLSRATLERNNDWLISAQTISAPVLDKVEVTMKHDTGDSVTCYYSQDINGVPQTFTAKKVFPAKTPINLIKRSTQWNPVGATFTCLAFGANKCEFTDSHIQAAAADNSKVSIASDKPTTLKECWNAWSDAIKKDPTVPRWLDYQVLHCQLGGFPPIEQPGIPSTCKLLREC